MARNINWSEPLSDEDREWAEQRLDAPSGSNGRSIAEAIEANDEEFGAQAKAEKKTRAERMSDLRTVIANSTNELARLEQEQIDEDNVNRARAGSLGDQAKGLGFNDQTPVNGEAPEGASTAKEDYSDTVKWTKASLTEEISRRNVDREAEDLEPLAKTGNRSELVERLLRDDEELAGAN
jgi:hypothetical protein